MRAFPPRGPVYGGGPALSKPRPPSRFGAAAGPGPTLAAIALALVAAAASAPRAQDEPPFVGDIRFEGNRALSDGELKGEMRTREPRFFQVFKRPRYLRDYLRRDLATLEAYYRRAGFVDARVASLGEDDIRFDPERYRVDIRIRVDEGKRRYLRSLIFRPALGELEAPLRAAATLRPGRPFDPTSPTADQQRIAQALQQRGYFSSNVRFETALRPSPAGAATDSIDVIVSVEPGPRAQLGELRFEGHQLPEALIRREMTVREGRGLVLADLVDSKQNLLDTGYFRSVDYLLEPAGGERTAESEPLRAVWILRERKMAAMETGVGWGTADGLRLTGGWSHRNLFNRGQRLALESTLSLDDVEGRFGLRQDRQAIEYGFLKIVRLRASLSLGLERERQRHPITGPAELENIVSRAVRLGAAHRLSAHSILRLAERVDFLSLDYSGDPTVERETRSFLSEVERDTRDHYFNPSAGGQQRLSVEVAGGLQGGDHDFYRAILNASGHQRRAGGVLAARLYLGGVWAYGASADSPPDSVPPDGVPVEERLFCGGSATVRGYAEQSLGPRSDAADPGSDPLGGRAMAVLNLEWRRGLPLIGRAGFQGVLFLDAGGTWLDPRQIRGEAAWPWQRGDREDHHRVFYGAGFGLRYLTPLAVIRVDLGIPLQPLDDTTHRWHFSLGQVF